MNDRIRELATQAGMTDEMNAVEALKIIRDRARLMREDGESDLRSILWLVDGLIKDIQAGKTKEEIMADFADEESEE